jgi:hypothetical protein
VAEGWSFDDESFWGTRRQWYECFVRRRVQEDDRSIKDASAGDRLATLKVPLAAGGKWPDMRNEGEVVWSADSKSVTINLAGKPFWTTCVPPVE